MFSSNSRHRPRAWRLRAEQWRCTWAGARAHNDKWRLNTERRPYKLHEAIWLQHDIFYNDFDTPG
jgi:hypothetical protein